MRETRFMAVAGRLCRIAGGISPGGREHGPTDPRAIPDPVPAAVSTARPVVRTVWMSASLLALAGCASLLPQATPPPAFYTLDGGVGATATAPRPPPGAPTLLVQPPQAAAGYESAHIVYTRQPQRLESFAHSEWVDTPARMLAPALVAALQASGAFQAVASSPSEIAGDLSLSTEILRLHQVFAPGAASQVRFTLRAALIDRRNRRLLAGREFDVSVPATSDDPAGGVAAADVAVRTVLERLAAMCAEAARQRDAASAAAPAGIADAAGAAAAHRVRPERQTVPTGAPP